jgi:hypothetical protein
MLQQEEQRSIKQIAETRKRTQKLRTVMAQSEDKVMDKAFLL